MSSDQVIPITVFMDESGTHGSPVITMSALAGDPENWVTFSHHVQAVFAQYGVNTFHAKDWKHHKGEFKGMPPDRRAEFLDRFGEAINTSVACACCAVLKMEDYRRMALT